MAGLFKKMFRRNADGEEIHFCSAVVAAAGNSSRMNGENKIFSDICGIPLIAHTLTALQMSESIHEIVVVAKEESIISIADICAKYGINKATKIVCGGETRLDSVLIGIHEVSKDAILLAIHDGARPLVEQRVISDTVKTALKYGACVPAVPVSDTIKRAKNGVITETLERDGIFMIQTPQVFQADILKGALENARKNSVKITDDAAAVELMGMTVHISKGSYENIKVTSPEDLIFAEAVVQNRGDL